MASLKQDYQQRIAAAAPSDKERIANEAINALAKAVTDQGLSLEEYDSILEVAQNDPEVREKIRQRIRPSATAELGGIEHPGLPVQQTVKLELVVNLKPRKRSASQYRNIVVAADEVIE